tara:strand:+ start:435 stop:764 length:330 start_codon:yes stop_codon:yes gene_type:complete
MLNIFVVLVLTPSEFHFDWMPIGSFSKNLNEQEFEQALYDEALPLRLNTRTVGAWKLSGVVMSSAKRLRVSSIIGFVSRKLNVWLLAVTLNPVVALRSSPIAFAMLVMD